MSNKSQQLHNQIMRRVYLAFGARILTNDLTIMVALFTLALYIFAELVHVASVIENFMAVNVGSAPQFIMSALFQGEVLTLLALGTIMFTLLSIPLRLKSMFVRSGVQSQRLAAG